MMAPMAYVSAGMGREVQPQGYYMVPTMNPYVPFGYSDCSALRVVAQPQMQQPRQQMQQPRQQMQQPRQQMQQPQPVQNHNTASKSHSVCPAVCAESVEVECQRQVLRGPRLRRPEAFGLRSRLCPQ